MPLAASARQAAPAAQRAPSRARAASRSAPVATRRASKIQIAARKGSDDDADSKRAVAGFFAAIAVAGSSCAISGPAAALGLESVPIPALEAAVARSSDEASPSSPSKLSRQAAAIADADEAFGSSDLLRTLKERTAANAAKNRQAIADKYCLRQAEMGVGDCSGLRLIPGATRSGKQKTPKLLGKLLGKEEAIEEYQNSEENEAAIAAVERMRKSAAQ